MPDRLTAELLRESGEHHHQCLWLCAWLCAFMHGQVQQAIAEHRPKQLLRMTYEDLQADPTGQLTAVGEFLGLADAAGRAARVAHRVRPPRQPAPAAAHG
jgi:putative sulfotransferase